MPKLNKFVIKLSLVLLVTNTTLAQQTTVKPGNTWAPVALNKEGETVSAFVTGKNSRIIAGTSAGLLLSDDKGNTWKPAAVKPDDKAAVFSIAKDDAGNLFAGLSKYGVLVSADNGNSWTLQQAGLNAGGPRTSYAMLATGPRVLKGTNESGLYVSDDKGKSWAPNNNGIPLNTSTSRMVTVSALAKGGATIYALTDLGVRWSADNGKSFNKPRHNGIERLGYMSCIAADAKALFCGVATGDKGVFVSTDNGENWKPAGLKGVAISALSIIGGKLYAGTEDGQIHCSADQGNTWTVIGKGLPDKSAVYAIGVSPDGKLLAGLNRAGIYLLN